MKRVYIAGPISKGDLAHNLNQATAAFVQLAKAGLGPFCPHWSVYSKPCERDGGFHQYPDGRDQPPVFVPGRVMCEATTNGNQHMTHEEWIALDLAWVGVSDAVLRLPGESTGSDREVDHAVRLGIPVFYTIEALIAWSKS